MIGMTGSQRLDKNRPGGRGCKVEQVSWTAAVRRPEARQWHGSAQGLQHRRPVMLPPHRIGAVPKFGEWRMAAQKINVPMGAGGNPGVMGHSRPQSAGAEGAADVDAATGSQAHFTELADFQGQGFRNGQQQSVDAGA